VFCCDEDCYDWVFPRYKKEAIAEGFAVREKREVDETDLFLFYESFDEWRIAVGWSAIDDCEGYV
jgi:hypothetical protein